MNFFNIVKNENGSAEIEIYNPIGIGGWFSDTTSAQSLISSVKNLNPKQLTLRLNSPGGSVSDGVAIYNFLKNSSIQVETIVDGVAASIASIIALAGKTRKIALGGMIMIHNPSRSTGGESKDLRKYADILDQYKEQLLDIYVLETGLKREELSQMMDEETWLTAKESKAKSFVHEVMNDVRAVACADLDQFNYQNKSKYTEIFNFKPEKPASNEVEMKELLKVMNCTDEASAIRSFVQLQQDKNDFKAKNEALSMENETLKKKQNEQTIELAIVNQKILPAQKDFALQCLNQSQAMYDAFIQNNAIQTPSLSPVPIPTVPNQATPVVTIQNVTSYEDLLNDTKLEAEMAEKAPEKYEQLYQEYCFKGGK